MDRMLPRYRKAAAVPSPRVSDADMPGYFAGQRPPNPGALHSDELVHVRPPTYEYSDPISFGGPAGLGTAQGGAYPVQNPFSTPAEWSCFIFAFGGAGQTLLTPDTGQAAPGLTSTLDPTARIRGLVAISNAAGSVVPNEVWTAIEGSRFIYLANTITGGNSIFATVRFRRPISPGLVFTEGLVGDGDQ